MPARVVDPLEMVDVEQDQGQRGPVSRRERELGPNAILKVLLVEDLREPVTKRRIVHLLLKGLFEGIVIGELENGRLADLDLVTIDQLLTHDACAIDVRPITRAEILDVGPAVLDEEAAMPAPHLVFDEAAVGFNATAEDGGLFER